MTILIIFDKNLISQKDYQPFCIPANLNKHIYIIQIQNNAIKEIKYTLIHFLHVLLCFFVCLIRLLKRRRPRAAAYYY